MLVLSNIMALLTSKLLAIVDNGGRILALVVTLAVCLLLKFKSRNSTVCFDGPVFRRTLNRIGYSPEEFCLVSYNILSDNTIGPGMYLPLPPKENLKGPNAKQSRRHKQMMKELRWLQGDIINLQEVEKSYFPIIAEELRDLGFKGVHVLHSEDTNGLAMFVNTKRFQIEKAISHNFSELLVVCNQNHFINTNMYHRERTAQFTLLQERKTGRQIVIANVHLMYGDWKEPDLHALQASLFLQQVHKFASSVKEGHTVPWVISGDFNMYPHFPVYELVANGKVSKEGLKKLNPFRYKYPQITEQNAVGNNESYVLKKCGEHLFHPLKDIKSAYKTILGNEPPLTHYEVDENFPELFGFEVMKGTLDYIWYSSDKLQVNAVLEPVKEEIIKPLIGCPNKFFPSDHFSLKACFKFK